jgi:hypothetical protein
MATTAPIASVASVAFGFLVAAHGLLAAPVPVQHPEGKVHGFLDLRDVEGKVLASGELTQSVSGERVTARLSFVFADGSVQEETTVYTQRRTFRLVSDHLVQKGPAFGRPIDLSVNAHSGQVEVRTVDEDGREKSYSERMKLPADVANGLLTTLLSDLPEGADGTEATPPSPSPAGRCRRGVTSWRSNWAASRGSSRLSSASNRRTPRCG